MTGNFFVGAVTEYGGASLDRMQRGAPDVGVPAHMMSGGLR
jgi:hypothetical protein